MKKYQDILFVSHINGENYFDFIVSPNIFTSVANKNGLYIVGKCAYRLLGEYVLRVNREKINELLSIHYSDIKNNKAPSEISLEKYCNPITFENKQNIKPNVAPITGGGGGGGGSSTGYTVPAPQLSAQNQTTTRMVKLFVHVDTKTEPAEGGTPYEVIYDADVEAQALQRYWVIGWEPYKTRIYIEGTNNGTDFSVDTPWGIFQYDVPTLSDYTKDYMLPHPDYGFDSKVWFGSTGPEIGILSAHLKAWTRGTTQSCYAEINYDYIP